VREGDEISIITYGAGVHWAEDYAAEHPEISIDILDLRSLLPWIILQYVLLFKEQEEC